VKGTLLKQFLDHIAEEGGGGIAGLQMAIREKKAVNILIQGQPFDPEKTYTVVNSDYVVNGGGRFTAFRGLPAQNTGYLLRDAILDYCAGYQSAGKTIPASADKRIVHE
jgi:2',3'-cyclic-nucleotide 2'-phosphodiesterase (5'-nucleotidase family)